MHDVRDVNCELLLLSLDAVTVALPASAVIEVTRAVAITVVPGCPESVEGLVNVRGTACPVYDLRRRFGLPARAVGRSEHMVVVTVGDRGWAVVRASRVQELRKIDLELVAHAAQSTDPVIAGLVQLPDGLLVICDLVAFLSDLETAQTAQAVAAIQAGP